MAEEATWMDAILITKTDEWLDGYIFAMRNRLEPSFYFRRYDSVYTDEEGLVYIFEDDLEEEE